MLDPTKEGSYGVKVCPLFVLYDFNNGNSWAKEKLQRVI